MAVCLDYQSVHARRQYVISVRFQILMALLLIVALLSKVWIKVESTQLGYELASERQLAQEQDMLRRELELEISVLTRADNLERLARTRLGLTRLNPEQAWRLSY